MMMLSSHHIHMMILVGAISLLGLSGCGQTGSNAGPAPSQPSATVSTPAEKAPASPEKAATAKLTDEDKKLIEKQKVCPVTDEKLGSMGEPYKVVVKGRTVFLCCEGCKDEIEANPDKYLKKLDEKK
jgi:YHS domain-containing protein